MISKELTVLTRAGIHARPAAEIVKVASKFKSELFIEKENMKINGKSIMGIITLGAIFKTKLLCTCIGEDEEEMLSKIEELFNNRFEQ